MFVVFRHTDQNLFQESFYSDSLGLQYQEDLKIRAMNDVTARKDKEHLEVGVLFIFQGTSLNVKTQYLSRK